MLARMQRKLRKVILGQNKPIKNLVSIPLNWNVQDKVAKVDDWSAKTGWQFKLDYIWISKREQSSVLK